MMENDVATSTAPAIEVEECEEPEEDTQSSNTSEGSPPGPLGPYILSESFVFQEIDYSFRETVVDFLRNRELVDAMLGLRPVVPHQPQGRHGTPRQQQQEKKKKKPCAARRLWSWMRGKRSKVVAPVGDDEEVDAAK
mmetsp:Transcript_77351/g.239548  ORF Transcript_77351/g.239548 Transcript_77351/m.239548 type:complete len:137 (-) Transcript_77351:175-585(-)